MIGYDTLRAAANALRTRQISAVELTEAALADLADWEPQIHAMVTVTAEAARAQAREADRRLAAGESGDLLGIPIVLKDLIDVAGVPTTAGSRVLADNVAQSDAPVWNRLRSAGAVLLGKANTHEFAYGGTTEPTRNPLDPTKMVGGSSGGPAAALAAGYALGAVGTDTAGSIRNPAGLCGVAGLKPTRGLVEAGGVIPLSPMLDVVGPMARTVGDLAPLLRVMAPGVAADAQQPGMTASRPAGQDPEQVAGSPRGLRTGLVELGRMNDRVAHGLAATKALLEGGGARVQAVQIPGCEDSIYDDFTIIGYEAARYHHQWQADRDKYTPYVRQRLDEGAATSEQDYQAAVARARSLETALNDALADCDVLLLPGVPFEASPAYEDQVLVDGESEDRDTALCRNLALANLSGHPALALPAPAGPGLPVGVQLLGRHGSDLDLIRWGTWLEEQQ